MKKTISFLLSLFMILSSGIYGLAPVFAEEFPVGPNIIEADLSVNNFAGVLSDNGTLISDEPGNVLSGYMQIPSNDKLNNALSNQNPFTFEMYFKNLDISGSTGQQHRYLMAKGDNQAALRLETNEITFYARVSGTWRTNKFYKPSGFSGNWHHIAAVFTGSDLLVYCDGILLQRSGGNNFLPEENIQTSTSPLGINYNCDKNANENGDNLVSTARIYSKALSEAEINAQMDAYLDGGAYEIEPEDSDVLMWLDFNQAKINVLPAPSADNIIEADKSVNNFAGRLSDTGTITLDEPGKVLSGYATIPSNDKINNAISGRNPFTCEMYLKPVTSGTGTQILIAKGDNQVWVRHENNKLQFGVRVNNNAWRTNSFTMSSANWFNGKWRHIAAVSDGEDLIIYCDGAILPREGTNQFLSTDTISTSNDPLGLNYCEGKSDRTGKNLFSSVKIYTKALSLAEIQAQRNACLGNSEYSIKPDNRNVLMWLDFNNSRVAVDDGTYFDDKNAADNTDALLDNIKFITAYKQTPDIEAAKTAFENLTVKQAEMLKNKDAEQIIANAEAKARTLFGAVYYIKDASQNEKDAPSNLFRPSDLESMGAAGTTFTAKKDRTSPTGYSMQGYFASPDKTFVQNAICGDTKSFTMEVWVNPSDLDNYNTFISKGNNQAIKIDGQGRLEFFIQNSGGWQTISVNKTSIPGFIANKWHHIVGTYDGQNLKFYLNGALIAERDAGTTNMSTNQWDLGIGRSYDSNSTGHEDYKLRGKLAAARIYTKALSAEEVLARYNKDADVDTDTAAAVEVDDASVLLWYDIDENIYSQRTTSDISVAEAPDKTDYVAGETLDASGLEVLAQYNPGISGAEFIQTLNPDEYTLTVNGKSVALPLEHESDTVTVTHTESGKTASFSITVSAAEDSDEEWTVTIPVGPKTVLLTPDEVGETQDIGIISCSRPNITGYESKTVSVTVSTLNGEKLTLKDGTEYIPGSYAEYLLNESTWSFPASLYDTDSSAAESIELTVTDLDNIVYAGTYEDVLTFTVAYN